MFVKISYVIRIPFFCLGALRAPEKTDSDSDEYIQFVIVNISYVIRIPLFRLGALRAPENSDGLLIDDR